jgi:polysaccharide chain length determinant protein (PEP-CTERM system associated)
MDVTLRRQEAERHLEELLLKFTDKHPEVIATRQTLADLKRREEAELAELARGGMGTGAIRSLSANPVYQQIQAQLNQAQVEIASIQGAINQHRAAIANLRKFVDQAPEIEQELGRLNRDYDVTKAQYEQLVARREQARVTSDAVQTGVVRFDVIEPPRAEMGPVEPNRPLLIAAALVAALAIGVGLGILPQLLSPAFSDSTSLESKFGLPVLGTVSQVRTGEQRSREHAQLWRAALVGVALLLLAGVLFKVGDAGAQMLRDLMA